MSKRVKASGFTLVELLVVIGIIALLISILLPSLNAARGAAAAISCSARMRQLTSACLMYADDNKGFLPPITANGVSIGQLQDRPTIFPCGGEGYLPKYLGKTVPSNTPSRYLISTLPSAKLYACPDVARDMDHTTAISAYSYRYNSILGGADKVRKIRAYGPAWSTTKFPCVPWKLSQVKQASTVALWGEGDVASSAISHSAMALDTLPGKNTKGKYDHRPRYGVYLHSRKKSGNTQSGVTNIGYCDGSVRAVQWKYFPDVANQIPLPDTSINPYHATETDWDVDEIH